MISTILADDEILARQKLREMLLNDGEIQLVGECGTTSETLDLVRRQKPELLFLDIRMHGRDAFDVVAEVSSDPDFSMPTIIFTTAHDGYALRAFEVHAADYLLKPFTAERLKTAIRRATLQIQSRLTPPAAHQAQNAANPYANRIV